MAEVFDFAAEKARRRCMVTIREPRGCGECLAGWLKEDGDLIKCHTCWGNGA